MGPLCRSMVVAAAASACGVATAEIVRPETATIFASPGSQVRSVWFVTDADTPLFGYSLDITCEPAAGATGSVAVAADESTFYPPRNVFVAAGHPLDPFFSVIESDGSGGVFLNTNSADFAAVLPVPGVNDALAELVIAVSPDASGDFVFRLTGDSALSDAAGFPVAFTSETLTVRVVPAPGCAGFVVLVSSIVARRPRRSR